MLENFIQIGLQVLVLFMLMAVGLIAAKMGFLTNEVCSKMTDFVLYFVAPALVIVSFQMEFNTELLTGLGITALLALVIQVLNIILAKILIRHKDKSKECVMQFGAIFSNCGFMGLPLDQALFGSEGVFYGAAYIAIFNILSWSYGIILMNKGHSSYHLSLKKVFINPGTVGVAIALVFFLTSIKLPMPIYSTLNYLGSLNTPMPMFIIGASMLGMSLKQLVCQWKIYLPILIRLVVIPVLAIIIMIVLKIDPLIAGVVLIGASAPTAALTSMFAVKFEKDNEISVNLIALCTLFSVVTMPLLIAFLQTILA